VFDHLKAKDGFVPDGINVVNEPDLTPWTGGMSAVRLPRDGVATVFGKLRRNQRSVRRSLRAATTQSATTAPQSASSVHV
jgi:hypothetical protein